MYVSLYTMLTTINVQQCKKMYTSIAGCRKGVHHPKSDALTRTLNIHLLFVRPVTLAGLGDGTHHQSWCVLVQASVYCLALLVLTFRTHFHPLYRVYLQSGLTGEPQDNPLIVLATQPDAHRSLEDTPEYP